MGKISRFICESGGICVSVVDSTDIVFAAERIHGTSATASAALGRTLTAASLMGALSKNERDSFTLQIKGTGPLGLIVAVSDYLGNVRGFCANPSADLPINRDTGKLDVSGVVGGSGVLSVIRDLGMKEPYIGQIELVSGEIAEDIANYYAVSEQIPTVCALGVLVNPDLSVKSAGGFLLQLLPGVSDEEIAALERNISELPSVTSMMSDNYSNKDIADRALSGFTADLIDEYEVEYRCGCSDARMREVLISLGEQELSEMAAGGQDTEIVCSFCGKRYNYSPDEIISFILR